MEGSYRSPRKDQITQSQKNRLLGVSRTAWTRVHTPTRSRRVAVEIRAENVRVPRYTVLSNSLLTFLSGIFVCVRARARARVTHHATAIHVCVLIATPVPICIEYRVELLARSFATPR